MRLACQFVTLLVVGLIHGLTGASEVSLSANVTHTERNLGLFTKLTDAWPAGFVCVAYQPDVTPEQIAHFADVFAYVLQTTGVHVIPLDKCQEAEKWLGGGEEICGGCTQAVTVTTSQAGCFATIGYHPTNHLFMNLGPGCQEFHIYLHEVGHVLGLYHEHSHSQRPVIIIKSKMKMPVINYQIFKDRELMETPYDQNSIMHYDGKELCLPKQPLPRGQRWCDVIEPPSKGCVDPTPNHCDKFSYGRLGRAKQFTARDIANVKALYPGLIERNQHITHKMDIDQDFVSDLLEQITATMAKKG